MMRGYTEILTTDEAIFKRAFYEVLHDVRPKNQLISHVENLKSLQRFLDVFPKCDYRVFNLLLSEKTTTTSSSKRIYEIPELTNCELDEKRVLSLLPSLAAFVDTVGQLPRNEYKYSIEMDVFLLCSEKHEELFNNTPVLIDQCLRPKSLKHPKLREDLNTFLLELHCKLKEPKTRKQILDKRAAVHKTYIEMKNYLDSLIKSTPQLGVLRINFGYSNPMISFEKAKRDMNRFYGNKRHNKLFGNQNGFIVNIEYKQQTGFYFHLLVFFDCSEWDDFNLFFANKIGRYWQNITVKNAGRYWFNDDKNTIGEMCLLSPDDIEKKRDLLAIIEYYKKKELFVKPNVPPKTQLMRKGECHTR